MNKSVLAILTDTRAFALAEECIQLKRRLADKLTAFDELVHAISYLRESLGEVREMDVAESLEELRLGLLDAIDDIETNREMHALRARSRPN
ncbi:MAG: hypothetical protein Q8M09_15680 [Pseudomonadota bacterium]|nr:hypothetical protein [Pseudomonadota bacterium]MDP1905664.1 hypothetical protein [Pseudomonadota bacterium]MDP2353334.1 hypothetical protein [Pseudomonadota bacterium]